MKTLAVAVDDLFINPPDVKTPLQYFQDYFSDDFFSNAAEYTKTYCISKRQRT